MGIFEIISAIVLIIACVFIVIVVLMNDTKSGMSQAISGASSDSFYQKNSGRTKEAKLNRAMVVATIVFFVLAFAVNIINVHLGKIDTAEDGDTTSGITTTVPDASTAEAATGEVGIVDESTSTAEAAQPSTASTEVLITLES